MSANEPETTWAGWLGRRAAEGTLLYLACLYLQWTGVVIIITQCEMVINK